jgi:hypothetical protein
MEAAFFKNLSRGLYLVEIAKYMRVTFDECFKAQYYLYRLKDNSTLSLLKENLVNLPVSQ